MLNSRTPPNNRPTANYSIILTPTSAVVSPAAVSPSVPGSPDDPSPRRPKRRKVKLACRTCRRRKTRCDGTLPVCQACTSRGVEATCIYINVADEFQSQPTYQDVNVAQLNHHGAAAGSYTDGQTHQQGGPQDGDSAVLTSPRPRSGTIAPIDTRDDNNLSASTDALATVAANPIEGELVYGSSSTIAFVHNFTHGLSEQRRQPNSTGQDTSNGARHFLADPVAMAHPAPVLKREPGSFLLPPRRTADNYVRCFWEFIHPLFPVLHKTSFMEKYSRLWTGDDDMEGDDPSDINEGTFSSTLNLVFAIGCQFSHSVPPHNKVSIADDFYQRSRKAYVYDVLDSTSVSVVQMLLLSGVYLQSTRYASRCWNVVGLAIRTAQSLGLHLDMAKYRTESQVNREMRRRIWHTCHVLDKLLAMTFGRPAMISNNWNVPLPSVVDDDYLQAEGEGVQPSDVPSHMGLLVCSSNLFVILDEILGSLYSESIRNNLHEVLADQSRVREMLSTVMLLNRRLEEFVDTVPEYIRGAMSPSHSPKKQDAKVQLQEQVLFCRYQYTRLLLLRPILLLATKPSRIGYHDRESSTSLDGEFIKSCCNLCIKTAQSLIQCVHQHLDTLYRSSGWHSVYFTFAAGTILLAGLSCPIVDESLIQPSFETNWNRCLSILEHYKQQIQSAPRAVQALKALRAQIAGPQTREPHDRSPQFETAEWAASQPDFNQFHHNSTDFLDDTWFSQHIINLDWLEFC